MKVNNSNINHINTNTQLNDNYINVICRIRPPADDSHDEKDLSTFVTSNFTNATKQNKRPTIPVSTNTKYSTKNTLSKNGKQRSIVTSYPSSQEEFYQQHISKHIQSIKEGYNGTIIAYGGCGTGKSYTIHGRDEEYDGNNNNKSCSQQSSFTVSTHHGIRYRAIHDIFDYFRKWNQGEVSFTLSYLQIYRELLLDLLSIDDDVDGDDNYEDVRDYSTTKMENKRHQRSELYLREQKSSNNKTFSNNNDRKHVTIENLRNVPVSNINDCFKLLRMGDQKRATCHNTEFKSYNSSRSHTIIILTVTKRHKQSIVTKQKQEHMITTNTLTLVDLAGSERIDLSNAITSNYQRVEELKSNNLSLTALRNCISSLSKGNNVDTASNTTTTFIPYRDSKLTRILQPSLAYNGHNKTLFIVCLPSISLSSIENQTCDNENKEIMIRHSMEFAQLLATIPKNKVSKVEANIDYESLYHLSMEDVDHFKDSAQLLEMKNYELQSKLSDIQEKMEDIEAQNISLKEAMRLMDSNSSSHSTESQLKSPISSKKDEDAEEISQLRKEEVNHLLQIHQEEVQQLKKKYNQQISAYKESASKSTVKYDKLHQETIQQKREHLAALQTIRELTQQLHDVENEKTKRISDLLNELQVAQYAANELKETLCRKEDDHNKIINDYKAQLEEKNRKIHEKENHSNEEKSCNKKAHEAKILKEMETLFTDTLSTLSERVKNLEEDDNNRYGKTTATNNRNRKNMNPNSRKILESMESKYLSSISIASKSSSNLVKKGKTSRWMGKSYR